MSGIAGIIHFDGKPVEPGLIEKMTSAMAHRGPDGIHHWVKGSVALGQCMLRTTPESLEEHQPLTNEDDSLVLVMDGRVDNSKELRETLLNRGAMLRDHSDAELVLKAYEVWGEECPSRIIGEFVFFIWKARQRRLFGARDAVGTRHFYYSEGNGWFGFSSEINGLLALGLIEPRMNESRLLDYLVVEFDRDDEVGTFYHGINRLPAGHSIRVTDERQKLWRYWTPDNLPTMIFSSLDECAEAFLEQFRIAVKCRLRSIGPVGAMLSGGLDSSSIVGIISKEFRDVLKQPLKTFSLIRKDRENCYDWKSIQEILKDEWFDSTIITSDIASHVFRFYYDSIEDLNEPFDLTNGFLDSLVYKTAYENDCRVVLDGMAGDLLFYTPVQSMNSIYHRKVFSLIIPMLTSCQRHGLGIQYGFKQIIRKILHARMPEKMREVFRDLRHKRELKGNKLNETPGNLLRLLHLDTAEKFLTAKRSKRIAEGYFSLENDQKTHSQCFTTGMLSFAHEVNGRIALSQGVEPRSPFSDRRLIEFAIRMPLEAKLSVPWYKFVLRKSMAGFLPEEVRWRKRLGGNPGWKFFEQFISEMASNAPEMWCYSSLNDNMKRWVDSEKLRQTWDDFDRTKDYCAGFNLFILVVLSEWLNKREQQLIIVE